MSAEHIRNASDLARFKAGLRIECGECGNARTVNGFELAQTFGSRDFAFVQARLKCERCGRKAARSHVWRHRRRARLTGKEQRGPAISDGASPLSGTCAWPDDVVTKRRRNSVLQRYVSTFLRVGPFWTVNRWTKFRPPHEKRTLLIALKSCFPHCVEATNLMAGTAPTAW